MKRVGPAGGGPELPAGTDDDAMVLHEMGCGVATCVVFESLLVRRLRASRSSLPCTTSVALRCPWDGSALFGVCVCVDACV